jgi:hypothetical protein
LGSTAGDGEGTGVGDSAGVFILLLHDEMKKIKKRIYKTVYFFAIKIAPLYVISINSPGRKKKPSLLQIQ